MDLCWDVIIFESALESEVDSIQIAIYALPKNTRVADSCSESGCCLPSKNGDVRVLFQKDKDGDVVHE